MKVFTIRNLGATAAVKNLEATAGVWLGNHVLNSKCKFHIEVANHKGLSVGVNSIWAEINILVVIVYFTVPLSSCFK